MILGETVLKKFDTKPLDAAFQLFFERVVLDYVGMDICAKFGDSRLNNGRIILLWPVGPVLRTFVQYLIAFCSRSEAPGDVISGMFVVPVVLDKCVKLHEPSLNRSRDI